MVHARSTRRADDLGAFTARTAGVVVGDLADLEQVRALADDANRLGPFDAVIHNAGIYVDADRNATPQEHARVLAVNVLAPYMLTVLIDRPARLVYLTSGMHRDGDPTLSDIDWTERRWNGVQAYCDSKLYVTALAAALARRWPDVLVNAADPGWVPTRMGGPHATDDLTLGHVTQVWLAASDDSAATVTGRYWYHQRPEQPAPAVDDVAFQDALLDELARLTGVELAEHLEDHAMPRTIATNTGVDRDGLLEFVRPRHHVVLATTRGDGSPQLSPVTAGIDPDGRVVVATYPERAKTGNARRNPAGGALFLSDEWNGPWVQMAGRFEVLELPDALEPLVDYYRSIAGEHPDWDGYRTAMVDQGKCLLRLTIDTWGPIATGGFPAHLAND